MAGLNVPPKVDDISLDYLNVVAITACVSMVDTNGTQTDPHSLT